jgi:hypothetical protein
MIDRNKVRTNFKAAYIENNNTKIHMHTDETETIMILPVIHTRKVFIIRFPGGK